MKSLLHCCGIYEIRNMNTGTRYIGSSARLGRRLNDHKYMLRRGKHHCVRLQRAWDRDGEAAFQFNILVVLEPSEQLSTEQRFLDDLKAAGEDLYNVALSAEAPNLGRKASPETRAKLSAERRRRFADPAVRQRLSDTLKGMFADPDVRAKRSKARAEEGRDPEIQRKKSEAMRRYYADPENRAKTGRSSLGRVWSDDHRAKLSASIKLSTSTPEARAARSARMKARWADPVERERILASKRKKAAA